MSTLFISDLHLELDRPGITQLFLNFLKTLRGSTLYILGDFFESWIGDDDLTPFHQTIIQALANAPTQAIYFMPGNRDFLIGSSFAKMARCQLLTDPVLINLYGTRTLLTHGDILCVNDFAYQKFRKRARNPIYQKIFLHLPLKLRRWIAQSIRNKSQQTARLIEPESSSVRSLMEQYQAECLIHGHIHRNIVENLDLAGKIGQRIVLKDWSEREGQALIYTSKNEYDFICIKN